MAKPLQPSDLIGPAARIAFALERKAARLRENGGTLKLLLTGPPGTGKTTVARMVSSMLADSPLAIEKISGKLVSVDTVRAWVQSLAHGNMFSAWSVRIVNELDRCSRDAQDLLLSYLDDMPSGRAFIGTSNLEADCLTPRLQTRFQTFQVGGPEPEEIEAWLLAKFNLPPKIAGFIGFGAGGCVRAAILDAESWLDMNS